MTKTSKAIISSVLGLAMIFVALFSVGMYGDYVFTSRQLAYLAAKIELSGISKVVKNNILADIYTHIPKGSKPLRFAFDFSSSNAAYVDTSSIAVDCTELMRDFLGKAKTCLTGTPDGWWSRAFYGCPAASDSADALLKQCNVDLNWR